MDSARPRTTNEYVEKLQEKARQNDKKHSPRRVAVVFLAVFIFLTLAVFTKANNFFSIINKNSSSNIKERAEVLFSDEEKLQLYKDDNRENILLLGIRGEDDMEHGGLLTDTIMVLSVDTSKKTAALISVPRDIYLHIPGTTKKDKINAAYLIGEEKLPSGGGLELSKRAVEYVTGLYINNVVSVDFKAFKEIIDELGGVDIYLDKEFREDKQWGGINFYVAPGWQHLEGDIVLYYVRSRYSSNDFDRGRRQQQVLVAMKDKAMQLGFLANPFKINSVLDTLQRRIRTDLTIFEIVKLSKLTGQIENNNIRHKVLSTENYLSQTHIDGAYVLLPKDGNFEEIRKASKEILN